MSDGDGPPLSVFKVAYVSKQINALMAKQTNTSLRYELYLHPYVTLITC